MSLLERDGKVIWHPYTQALNADPALPIVRAEGAYLYTEEGKRYLDGISSWWVNLHGHAHPFITERISEQLKKFHHVLFAGCTHAPAVELAEKLIAILPENQQRVFYSDDGSTAVEAALKMALQYCFNRGIPRMRVIAFESGYHGDTFGAMSVSGRGAFTTPFASLLFEVTHIAPPLPGKEEESLAKFEALLKDGKVAAFIFEPRILGAAGMLMYESSPLDELLSMAKAHGVITIADEVMTGFGRTGRIFASDYLVNSADIFCFSKGLTGGSLPLGVTSCSEEIYAAFVSEDRAKTFFHGHSYTANPISCSAALASLELLLSPACGKQIEMISKMQLETAERLSSHPAVSASRALGTILALEVGNGSASYFHPRRDTLYRGFLARGILLRPLGNVVYVMPPYCIDRAQLQQVYSAIEQVLDES